MRPPALVAGLGGRHGALGLERDQLDARIVRQEHVDATRNTRGGADGQRQLDGRRRPRVDAEDGLVGADPHDGRGWRGHDALLAAGPHDEHGRGRLDTARGDRRRRQREHGAGRRGLERERHACGASLDEG